MFCIRLLSKGFRILEKRLHKTREAKENNTTIRKHKNIKDSKMSTPKEKKTEK